MILPRIPYWVQKMALRVDWKDSVPPKEYTLSWFLTSLSSKIECERHYCGRLVHKLPNTTAWCFQLPRNWFISLRPNPGLPGPSAGVSGLPRAPGSQMRSVCCLCGPYTHCWPRPLSKGWGVDQETSLLDQRSCYAPETRGWEEKECLNLLKPRSAEQLVRYGGQEHRLWKQTLSTWERSPFCALLLQPSSRLSDFPVQIWRKE